MKPDKKKCDLKSCVFCQQCLPEWLAAIDTHRQCFQAKKNELLFSEGSEVSGMFFINKGLVKVHKKWDDEKELILRIAKTGDIVGHRGLGADNIYPVSATALEPTNLCFVSLDFFDQSLKVNHDFLHNLLLFFAAELKESEWRMRNLAHMPVKGRIANALLTLKKKFGADDAGRIHVQLSRQDLASYTGTTYETLFRVINELVEENAIATRGKDILVADEAKLQGYVGR